MEHRLRVFIQGGAKRPDNRPPHEKVNYKPVVAVIFAIILIAAGVWSSKRRPWKGGTGRMAVVKAFLITSLPFVIAEAATGIISFITGELRIPPTVGVGTGVDLLILLAGLGVAVMRALRVGPSKAEMTDEPKGR